MSKGADRVFEGSPTGELHSLDELRSYLSVGLQTPGVRLDLIDACLPAAPNRVACVYRRESGNLVAEVFDVVFQDGEWKVAAVENFCGFTRLDCVEGSLADG